MRDFDNEDLLKMRINSLKVRAVKIAPRHD
jgi:hypothetical protein